MKRHHWTALGGSFALIVILVFGRIETVKADACGNLGEPACKKCVEKVTVYFPFNFCCIPEASSCEKVSYSCNLGYQIDAFGHCTKPNISVVEAVEAGCQSEQKAQDILTEALKTKNLGTTTRTKISEFSPSADWMTTLLVTAPDTWGYRATGFPAEITSMENGELLSKAQRRVAKKKNPQAFWQTNGPELRAFKSTDLTQSLQMIATSTSDQPASQFLSVALDYDVASGFGDTVYKFKMSPKSPVLGLRDCDLSKGGEVQIQVQGGTPITNLQRFQKSKGYWEKYKDSRWSRVN